MTWAKRIYILIIKVNKLFSFFSSRCFLKEMRNMYSVFLSSYTNTHESLGELAKAVETLAPTRFLVLPNFHSCLYNSIDFYFFKGTWMVKDISGRTNVTVAQLFYRYRLTPSASELWGFTCTSSLTMNEKFQYRTRPLSAVLLVNSCR